MATKITYYCDKCGTDQDVKELLLTVERRRLTRDLCRPCAVALGETVGLDPAAAAENVAILWAAQDAILAEAESIVSEVKSRRRKKGGGDDEEPVE